MKVYFNFLIILSITSVLFSCKQSLFVKKNVSSVNVNKVEVKKFKFPKEGYILIEEGDTVYSIANSYGLIPSKIIKLNNLKKPYKLKIGKKLFLPYPIVHNVIYGDTVFTLSLQYAVNQSDIVELNLLKKPYILYKGDKIKIPIEKDYTVLGLLKKQKIKKNNFKKRLKTTANDPDFIWPAKGVLVKKFGPFSDGKQHYDGIDLKVEDNRIIAAADGKIAFVGSKIKSFGNMILIKHNSQWISAYSKVGQTKVNEGDVVKKGQFIAFVKKDKIFHFQIRKSRNPIDPKLLLN